MNNIKTIIASATAATKGFNMDKIISALVSPIAIAVGAVLIVAALFCLQVNDQSDKQIEAAGGQHIAAIQMWGNLHIAIDHTTVQQMENDMHDKTYAVYFHHESDEDGTNRSSCAVVRLVGRNAIVWSGGHKYFLHDISIEEDLECISSDAFNIK